MAFAVLEAGHHFPGSGVLVQGQEADRADLDRVTRAQGRPTASKVSQHVVSAAVEENTTGHREGRYAKPVRFASPRVLGRDAHLEWGGGRLLENLEEVLKNDGERRLA